MKKTSPDIFEPEIPVVPPGWAVLPFEQAADVISDKGKRVKQRSYLPAGKIPVIDQGQTTIGGYTDDENMVFDDELPVILFGDHTRSLKYADKRFAVGAEGVKILRPREGYVPKFFYYLLCSLQIPSRGYSRHFQFLRKFHLPLAPAEQQKIIVAEIEKQFSRLDEAVANLKRVKANLKRYKSAVLKAAVEGRLVETEADIARRESHSYETSEQLLQRILETRRSQWKGKGKYKEPVAPDTTDLPELPEGWVWASLDQVTSKITSGSRDWSPYYGIGTSIFVLAQNVRPLSPDFSVRQLVDPPADDPSCERSRIKEGDLLATIVGANTGQVCLVSQMPSIAYVCQSVALMRPVLVEMSLYLNCWLNSTEHGQRYFERCMYGQGRPHLSFEQLMATPIAVPSIIKQRRIVADVERRFSFIREIEKQVGINLFRAQRLRQSILATAFSGRLIGGSHNSLKLAVIEETEHV